MLFFVLLSVSFALPAEPPPGRIEMRLDDRLAVTIDPDQGLMPHVLYAKAGGRWSQVAELDYEIAGAKARIQTWKPTSMKVRTLHGHRVYEVHGQRSVKVSADGVNPDATYETTTLTLCAAESDDAAVTCLSAPIILEVNGRERSGKAWRDGARYLAAYSLGADGRVTIEVRSERGELGDERGHNTDPVERRLF